MKRETFRNSASDAWFEAVAPEHRQTLDALRALIMSIAPDAVESIKWGRPCYANAHGLFCYLHQAGGHATLGFQQGAALNDPDGLLEGSGKTMRHIKFPPGRDPGSTAVRALIEQAAGA